MPSIPQIESILAIYQHRSVTAAARHLHRSSSTVSNHLVSVERSLGLPLFRWREGCLAATSGGVEFVRLSVLVLEAHSAMMRLRLGSW